MSVARRASAESLGDDDFPVAVVGSAIGSAMGSAAGGRALSVASPAQPVGAVGPAGPRGSVVVGGAIGGAGAPRAMVPRLCRQGSQGSPSASPTKTAMLSRASSLTPVPGGREPVRRKLPTPGQPLGQPLGPTAVALSHATPVCSTAAALAASSPCSSSMAPGMAPSMASLRSISEVGSDDETPQQKRRSSFSKPRPGHVPGGSMAGTMTTTQQTMLHQGSHQVVHQTTVRVTRAASSK